MGRAWRRPQLLPHAVAVPRHAAGAAHRPVRGQGADRYPLPKPPVACAPAAAHAGAGAPCSAPGALFVGVLSFPAQLGHRAFHAGDVRVAYGFMGSGAPRCVFQERNSLIVSVELEGEAVG